MPGTVRSVDGQPRNQQPGNATAEKEEKSKSETSAASNPLDTASGKTYVLFEGTILETVLLNRLDGDFAGPVEYLVANDIYSYDRQHLLIPSGTLAVGAIGGIAEAGSGGGRRFLPFTSNSAPAAPLSIPAK